MSACPRQAAVEEPMFEKFGPKASHNRLWPSLLVIGLIAAVGIVLLLGVSQ